MSEKEQLATLGEYSNYFSEGLFVELNEPLFVKKNWVPQWLWNLVSEARLSRFEFDRQSTGQPTKPRAIDPSLPDGDWKNYASFNFNDKKGHLETPSLPSAEWFAQAFHDVVCPIEEVGMDFRTYRERHPNEVFFWKTGRKSL